MNNLVLAFDYNDVESWRENLLFALCILGVLFVLLGWFFGKYFRNRNYHIQRESQELKKRLLDEINVSKKFNADYQLMVNKEKSDK